MRITLITAVIGFLTVLGLMPEQAPAQFSMFMPPTLQASPPINNMLLCSNEYDTFTWNKIAGATAATGNAPVAVVLAGGAGTNYVSAGYPSFTTGWTDHQTTHTAAGGAVADPNGGSGAEILKEDSSLDYHWIQANGDGTQYFDIPANATFTLVVDAHGQGNGRDVEISLQAQDLSAQLGAFFNSDTGSFDGYNNFGSAVPQRTTQTNLGNGWWEYTLTGTLGLTTRTKMDVALSVGTTDQYQGNGTAAVYIYGARMGTGTSSQVGTPSAITQPTENMSVALQPSTQYTLSWQAAAVGGASKLRATHQEGVGTQAFSSDITIDNTRHSYTFTTGTSVPNSSSFVGLTTDAADESATFNLQKVKLEAGASATTYIANTNCRPSTVPSGWVLNSNMSDDFNGASVDTTKWGSCFIGGSCTRSGELEDYGTAARVVHNGYMTLTATPNAGRWNSGMIRSLNTCEWPCYLETKVRFNGAYPDIKGSWLGFWLNPQDQIWPPEIDIMEVPMNGTDGPNCTVSLIHGGVGGADEAGSLLSPAGDYCPGSSYLNGGWHTFGADWRQNTVTFFADGVKIGTKDWQWKHNDGSDGGLAHILLNLAIGGIWATTPTNTNNKSIDVDYVRTYQPPVTSSGPLPPNILNAYYWRFDTPSHPNIDTIRTQAPQYNVLDYVAAIPDGTVNAHMILNSGAESGLATMISNWKASGRVALLMIANAGIGGVGINLFSSGDVSNFVTSISALVDTYGFQGIDWDLEDSFSVSSCSAVVSASAQLKAKYGSNFVIAAVPRAYEVRGNAIWAQCMKSIGTNLDLIAEQEYDSTVYADTSFAQIKADYADLIAQGFPSSKILLGSATFSGTGVSGGAGSPQTYANAFTFLKGAYGIRGAMVWHSKSDDDDQAPTSWSWAKALGTAIGLP